MDVTKESVKLLPDRKIQELEHDLLVDFIDDLSGSTHLSTQYELVKKERQRRNLKKLPSLNGNINLL